MTSSFDLDYLRRIAGHTDPSALLNNQMFLRAQELFFSVVESLGGTVDFDLADMREVHAVAALGSDINGKRILDIGCGSPEPYVLEDTFRDRYPPFFAEMLTALGAKVTGVDIRKNPNATYDHRVLDCIKPDWMTALDPPYDIIACFSVFNAPESPFEHDAPLCDRLMDEMYELLSPDGLLIITLRDDLFDAASSKEEQLHRVKSYASSKGFDVLHCDGNSAWLRRS